MRLPNNMGKMMNKSMSTIMRRTMTTMKTIQVVTSKRGIQIRMVLLEKQLT